MQIKKKVTVVASAVAAAAFAVAGVALTSSSAFADGGTGCSGTTANTNTNCNGDTTATISVGTPAVYGNFWTQGYVYVDPQAWTWNPAALDGVTYFATLTDLTTNKVVGTADQNITNVAYSAGQGELGGTATNYAPESFSLTGAVNQGDSLQVSVYAETPSGSKVGPVTVNIPGTVGNESSANWDGSGSPARLSLTSTTPSQSLVTTITATDTNAPYLAGAQPVNASYSWYLKPNGLSNVNSTIPGLTDYTDPSTISLGTTTTNVLTVKPGTPSGQIYAVETVIPNENQNGAGAPGTTNGSATYGDIVISSNNVTYTGTPVAPGIQVSPVSTGFCSGGAADIDVCSLVSNPSLYGLSFNYTAVGSALNAALTNLPQGATTAWQWIDNPASIGSNGPVLGNTGTVVAKTASYTPTSAEVGHALWVVATVSQNVNGIQFTTPFWWGPVFVSGEGVTAPTCTNGRTVVAGTNLQLTEGQALTNTTDGSVTATVVNGQLKVASAEGSAVLGQAGNYYWAFQDDGNVVQYNAGTGAVAYTSNTRVGSHAGNYVTVQCDGNVVVYPGNNSQGTGISILHI